MKKIALIAICFFMISCGNVTDTRSGSMLQIMSITDPDGMAHITSDVVTAGGVFDDLGDIKLLADTYEQPPMATAMTSIFIDRLDIEYSRSDGKNVPGKDVPYGFSQPVSLLCDVGAPRTLIGVVFVRHIAKFEPPLIDLINYGQEFILYLNCKVTVYGVDGAGKRIKPATGYIQIQCGNFADKTEG